LADDEVGDDLLSMVGIEMANISNTGIGLFYGTREYQ
jgi:hypothetical protein